VGYRRLKRWNPIKRRKRGFRRNPLTPDVINEVNYFAGTTPFAISSYGFASQDLIRLQLLLNKLKTELPSSQLKNEADYFAYILVANQATGNQLEMIDLYRLASLFDNLKQSYPLTPTMPAALTRRTPVRRMSILKRAQNWVDPLLDHLYEDPDFETIIDHATKICGGPIYLVGGQIFRRLSNIIHGTKLKLDRDWDVLCLGIPRWEYYYYREAPRDWEEEWLEWSIRGYFTTRFAYRPSDRIRGKLDVISIFDSQSILDGSPDEVDEILKQRRWEDALEIYFDSVPLDIQALALDITNEKLLGDQGLQAVWDKTIHLKRPESLAKWDIDPESYLKGKLKSLPGFTVV